MIVAGLELPGSLEALGAQSWQAWVPGVVEFTGLAMTIGPEPMTMIE